MRRWLYILYIVLLSTSAMAQGLIPVGIKSPANVVVQATSNESLYVVNANASNRYELSTWDGFAWKSFGEIASLPAHGVNEDGAFELKDAVWFDNQLFILGEYYINTSGNQSNVLMSWNGQAWTDLSNESIKKSNNLKKFLIYNGNLVVAGVFEDKNSNLLSRSNNTWEPLGGWLTLNLTKDYLVDLHVFKNQIYASGSFSKIGVSDIYHTATFDGKSWSSIKHPPFLNGSSVFELFNEGLILTGKPNNSSDFIKSFDGNGWNDASTGLQNYQLKEVWDAQSVGNQLYLVGDFNHILTGDRFNIIYLKNGEWKPVYWPYQTKKLKMIEYNGNALMVGDFNLFGIQGVAAISTGHALLQGNVFADANSDCLFSENERGIGHQVIIMNPGNHVFFTDENGRFEIPVSKGVYEITLPSLIKYVNKCSSKLTAAIDGDGNYEVGNFGLCSKPNVLDLKVSNGFSNGYNLVVGKRNDGKFVIKNNGTAPIDEAHFTLTMEDIWNSLNFSPRYSLQEGNKYVWVIKNLQVDEEFVIDLDGILKTGINPSDLKISYKGLIVNPQSDEFTEDNAQTLEFTEVDHIDPISKQCGNGAFFSDQSKLSYYIRFANVGKGAVSRVIVRDTIDEDVFISKNGVGIVASHPYKSQHSVIEGDKNYRYIWTWIFDEINLPDSTDQPNGYVGYVKFDISLATGFHPSGTVVCNEANVLFDKQEPYITNEVCTEARNLSVTTFGGYSEIQFYPNPAWGYVNIKNDGYELCRIEILNATGQTIVHQNIEALNQKTITTNGWAKGVYYVKINGYDCRKLIIQ